MKRFSLAAFLAAALCLSAVLCSSASSSSSSSSWVGKHRFTLIQLDPSSRSGVAVARHNKHNTLCNVGFMSDHHLSLGTVFTGFITKDSKEVVAHHKSVIVCSYSEWDGRLPVKAVGHVSEIAVRSVIENLPPSDALSFAPHKYRFIRVLNRSPVGVSTVSYPGEVSYPARAAKAVHRAEDSGKVVTVRIKISKDGLRHMRFVR